MVTDRTRGEQRSTLASAPTTSRGFLLAGFLAGLLACESRRAAETGDPELTPSAPAEPAATDSAPDTTGQSVGAPPKIDVGLLRQADAALAFVKSWGRILRGNGVLTTDPSGYEQHAVRQLYDTESFVYIRHGGGGNTRRGAWPVTSSFPELKHVGSHHLYWLQFAKPPVFGGEANVGISFVEDHTLRLPDSKPETTRGQKTLTLRPQGDGFSIVSEEAFERTKAPPGIPKPEPPTLQVPGAGKYILVAERPCSKASGNGCTIPGVFVLVAGSEGYLLHHLSEPSGELAPGSFVDDDPDRYFLESLHERTYYGFSFARNETTLSIEYGWADAEERRRIQNWSPVARVAMGSASPVPLWCLPLHAASAEPQPCSRIKSSL